MLKTISLLDKPTLDRNNSGRLASSKNTNSKTAFGKNNDNNEINKFDASGNNIEYAKKSGKSFM